MVTEDGMPEHGAVKPVCDSKGALITLLPGIQLHVRDGENLTSIGR